MAGDKIAIESLTDQTKKNLKMKFIDIVMRYFM